MISTIILINRGIEALNSTSERHTFLELIHEYFLYSMFVVLSDDFFEQFFGLAGMPKAFIIVINKKDAFVLEIYDSFFVDDHFHNIPFLDQSISKILLEHINSFSDALDKKILTLTN